MQCNWIVDVAVERVSRQEPTGLWVVVSGAEIVETEVGVVLFAAVEVVVRRGAGRAEQIAEGVVIIVIRYYGVQIRQLANTSEAIIAVEAGRPRAVDLLVLADALQAVGVRSLDDAVDRLLEDLRQAGRVHVVLHKVLRRHVAHLLCYAVAEAIVDHCNRAAVHRHKVVLRVVGEGLAAGGGGVAVGVVGLWREPVVEVEAVEADRLHAGQRGVDRGAVANRVERVVDLAVAARRVCADGLAGEPVDAVVVPGERAAGLLRCAGAVARGAELVAVSWPSMS